MYTCVVINEKDSVATATSPIKAGDEIKYRIKGSDTALKHALIYLFTIKRRLKILKRAK